MDHNIVSSTCPESSMILVQFCKSSIALWGSCNIDEKSNKKVVNFGNWFLCQFSPKTSEFFHGAFLTPQESGEEKKYKQKVHVRGGKGKKSEGGVFHRQDWSQFKPLAKINLFCKTNICEKHPLIAKVDFYSEK